MDFGLTLGSKAAFSETQPEAENSLIREVGVNGKLSPAKAEP